MYICIADALLSEVIVDDTFFNFPFSARISDTVPRILAAENRLSQSTSNPCAYLVSFSIPKTPNILLTFLKLGGVLHIKNILYLMS
jgi:hypothetical protein